MRLAAIGTYDNFNRFATRGVPGERTMELYDTLFTNSDDEPGSYYPLIAESARFPADMSWMELDINARARFGTAARSPPPTWPSPSINS